ncbi:phage terminase large subunit [Alteromonas sp.]|uniref:phage terminase large subunit n=1 Tax=Alteromonas sp. TaxID=232 RepID=UPI002580C8B0|nr:phage terminase large subunit [Alteromonas sp.]
MTEIPKALHDFRNFTYLVWQHLGLPEPTPIQYDIAQYLQDSPKRCIIEAFRGVGKSYITAAYVVHQLLLNPQLKFMVVSASKARADDFSTFTQRIICELPICQHLVAKEGQRWSKIAFDVAPAKASGSPSVKSVGVTGQLTGSRADIIIADDVEVPNNSMTHMMREKLGETVKEFDAVLKPEGKIIYLGTPQNEMSLYNVLLSRGYAMRVWPARYPTLERSEKAYGGRLAPLLYDSLQNKGNALYGLPTDAKRFDDEDLLERELSYGRSGFALQFMLDTSLSDANKYPLKLADLIIYSCDKTSAPEKIVYGIMKPVSDVPNVGLAGDKFYAPEDTIGRADYTGSVLAIDPSGRGSDETAYAIVKMLNGFLYVVDAGGVEGGYSEETLQHLTDLAKIHQVNMVLVESNFGDGMFTELLKPYLTKTYPVTIEEVRHSKQKEARIIDTLEPVMNQHRLIVDPKVVQKDYDSVQHMPPDKGVKYMLTYQMTRITKVRGALAHDDRLDVLAMAVQYWVDQMAADADNAIEVRKEELLDNELDKFMNSFNIAGASRQQEGWFGF